MPRKWTTIDDSYLEEEEEEEEERIFMRRNKQRNGVRLPRTAAAYIRSIEWSRSMATTSMGV